MFRLFAMFLMMCGVAYGGSKLMIEDSRKKWFGEADVVLTGKVIYKQKVYTSQGKVIDEKKALEVMEKYYNAEFMQGLQPGSKKSKEQLIKEYEAFMQSEDGKIIADLSWTHIVGVSVAHLHKGSFKEKQIFCSWRVNSGETCQHVAVNPEIGKDVSVYLLKMKQLKMTPTIFAESHFLMGPSEINKPE